MKTVAGPDDRTRDSELAGQVTTMTSQGRRLDDTNCNSSKKLSTSRKSVHGVSPFHARVPQQLGQDLLSGRIAFAIGHIVAHQRHDSLGFERPLI
jgi:hypothetical protein